MKKLLLILSAVFVSVMGWAGLNPYAYGLKSYLNDDQTELTMIYTLNADAEKSKENNPTAIGVQVYIFEKASGNIVKTLTNGSITQGTCTLTVATADLPKEVPLSWKVVVHGNAKQTQPNVVFSQVSNNRPNATHGVAIDKNPESQNFGNIYYTEASSGDLNTTWNWMEKYTRPCVWQYSPQLTYLGHFYKDKENNIDVGNFVTSSQVEPHRIRISDDNRIFVSSCYANATTAVWEYKGGNNFNKVITRTESYGKVLGMDVFGSGNDLKILLCYMSGSTLRFREYALGSAGSISGSGTDKGTYTDGTLVVSGTRVGVAYDDNGESFWFAIDRSTGYSSRVIHMKKSGNNYVCGTVNKCPLNTGGDGIFVKGNLLVKGIATSGDNTAAGRLYFFKINGDKIMNDAGSASLQYYSNCEYIGTWTSYWVNDIDMDYAGNLYIASAYAGNAIAISMPYDGRRETKARDVYTFTLAKPVPNILATDLRYDIVRGKNQYEFSFNVNTKPEEAQLRFYKSYEDMQKSFNVVNADYYDGTNNNKPLFVYNIPSDDLKQGRIAVKLGAVAGEVDANGVITNNRLPAGVLYWSVYVKTQKSTAFAPIYKQSNTREEDKHYRLHAAVNNYPETDFFGTVNVAQYDARANSPKKSLMIYGINPDGAVEESIYTSYNRYKKRDEYINSSDTTLTRFENQRHLTVAPNGMVFISDYGRTTGNEKEEKVMTFANGGVKVWDPNDPTNDDKSIKLSHFESKDKQSATAVDICKKNDSLYLYRTNTYSEFATHTDLNNDPPKWQWYTKANQEDLDLFGWNGFKKYSLGTLTNFQTSGPSITNYALKRGDASGTFEIVAMDQGVWMCQHREHTVEIKEAMKESYADNLEAYLLSFVPYNSDTRTWTSCTAMGKVWEKDGTVKEHKPYSEWSQTKTSPLQSTPGSGLAYKAFKDASGKVKEEMLYVVNHDGNIVVLQITGWTNRGSKTATPTVEYVRTLRTPESTKGVLEAKSKYGSKDWKTAAITSMNFDYAGNLVTTTGVAYFDMNVMKNEIDSMPEGSQNVIIYTMPYDRVNAREIQAPNSCIEIPERVAQLDMNKTDMAKVIENNQKDYPGGCAIDLYRPLQGKMFNTICLPFTVNLEDLPSTHPLFGATLREYKGLKLNPVGGEEMLELVFTDVQIIEANKPYIIQLKDSNGYNSIIRFAGPLKLTKTEGERITQTETGGTYSIFYQGIVPYQRVEPQIYQVTGESLTLMLVADNRLALMTKAGDMYGFRGYFQLNQPLPKGMQTRITNSKGTTTNTTIVVDGKKVNIEKYLREGRVYIRVGDSLYTVDGQLVK